VEVARVERRADLARVLEAMGLRGPRATLVVVGGAAKMSEDEIAPLEPLLADVAALAARTGAVVVDGGTDAGVIGVLGRARKRQPEFPLVGVVVAALVVDSEVRPGEGQAALEPNHSHVLLVPGKRWGNEAPWLAEAATILAGSAPSVTILVNGGDVAYADVAESVARGRQVLVLAGTGRTADAIADALVGGEVDAQAAPLVASGLVRAVEFGEDGPAELIHQLETILAARR
jgi:hypothetical protein